MTSTTDKDIKERTSICLKPDLLAWTRKYAQNNNMSVSKLIANALLHYKESVVEILPIEETELDKVVNG